jgi:gas vesicle protein
MSKSKPDTNSGGRGWLGGFVLGVATGAVAGVSAGLLSAPRSGRATRRRLKHEVAGQVDALRDAGDRLVERGEDMLEYGRGVAKRATAGRKE